MHLHATSSCQSLLGLLLKQQFHPIVPHHGEDEPPAAPAVIMNLLETSRHNVVRISKYLSYRGCRGLISRPNHDEGHEKQLYCIVSSLIYYIKRKMTVILFSVLFLLRLMCWSTNMDCRRTRGVKMNLWTLHTPHPTLRRTTGLDRWLLHRRWTLSMFTRRSLSMEGRELQNHSAAEIVLAAAVSSGGTLFLWWLYTLPMFSWVHVGS